MGHKRRYSISVNFNAYEENDKKANEKANEVALLLSKLEYNNAKVVSIVEHNFGSMNTREVKLTN